MEMPKPTVIEDLRPCVADPGDRGLEECKFLDLIRILSGIRIRNHQTDVMPDQIDLFITQTFNKLVDINCGSLLVVACRRFRRIPDAAKVWSNDRIVFTKVIKHRDPHM